MYEDVLLVDYNGMAVIERSCSIPGYHIIISFVFALFTIIPFNKLLHYELLLICLLSCRAFMKTL